MPVAKKIPKRWRGLRLILVSGLLVFACTGSLPEQKEDPGSGDTLTLNGARVLVVKGTHAQRGWWHGKLKAAQIKRLLDDFFVTEIFGDDSSLYAGARSFTEGHFIYNSHHRTEAESIIKGMRAAGTDLQSAVLGREFDAVDILMFNTLEELLYVTGFQFGCSSLSSWGTATAEDTTLEGELVISRFWDWEPFAPVVENLMLTVHVPAEAGEQPWVSAGWPGNIGACTGINASGLAAFLDYGNITDHTDAGTFQSVSLALRRAIEDADYNGDSLATPADIYDALTAFTPYFASIVHAVAPGTDDTCALVIESNNIKGTVTRAREDNTAFPGSHLAATNHFRKLYAPAEPFLYTRYDAIADSLVRDSVMTADRSWSLLTGAAGGAWALYQIQFIPATGQIRWRVSPAVNQPAHLQATVYLTLEQMFDLAE